MLGKKLSPRFKKLEDDFKNNGGEWKEVVAEELFSIKGNPQLNKDSFVFTEDEKYPYFTRTVLNNGVSGYVEYLDEEHKIKGNSIAVGMLGMQFFYMEKDFYAGQFTKTIFPKFEYFNRKVALYFVSLLNKNQKVFQSVLVRDFEKIFNEVKLKLPFLNGKINFSYMEKFIEELEAERIEELEAYLVATGLKDYRLTKYDENILDKFNELSETSLDRQTDRQTGIICKYKLGSLFDISTPKKKFNADSVKFGGEYPYVARGENNNGIRGYITEDKKFLNYGNTISFGQDTATMFYQKQEYFTGDKIKIFQSKNFILNKYNALYYIATTKKTLKTFSWGSTSYNVKNLENIELEIPTYNSKPNNDFMSDFIRVIEKLVIKDVVIWADKKIEATKQVAGRN
ncbi:restriction endonuclease subunit S [Helcococcus bovis]|uniref:Restriction endonuclease subunit S n=1 Tax=Helcococcus bovis TaxID=3153252 RepID=A0ABW9F602_9FIRM